MNLPLGQRTRKLCGSEYLPSRASVSDREFDADKNNKSAPHVFICIGHQLSAQAHVNLIKKAISAIRSDLPGLSRDFNGFRRDLLMNCCDQIEQVGRRVGDPEK